MNLLPCPFCGVKNPLFNVCAPPSTGWYIRCRSAKCAARVEAATAPGVMKRWTAREKMLVPAAIRSGLDTLCAWLVSQASGAECVKNTPDQDEITKAIASGSSSAYRETLEEVRENFTDLML